MVEAEAQQHTKSGAHARAILEEGYGIPTTLYIESIDLERNSKPAANIAAINNWSIAPNPSSDLIYVSFAALKSWHLVSLTLSDLNGRIYRQIDLTEASGERQVPLSTADLPSGVYLLHLHMEGQPSEIKKLTVIH